jgi:LPXTG-motif cell wall-anchored protein
MKTLLSTALLLLATTLGLAQTADQTGRDDRGANTPATRSDDTNHSNWGWLGLLGLAGLGGLAGRNRRPDMYERDRDRTPTDIRRAA